MQLWSRVVRCNCVSFVTQKQLINTFTEIDLLGRPTKPIFVNIVRLQCGGLEGARGDVPRRACLAPGAAATVEPMWHMQDSHGQILALTSANVVKTWQVGPSSLGRGWKGRE